MKVLQPLLLLQEAIIHHSIQCMIFGVDSLRALQIESKEALVARGDVSARPGFHIDHQFKQMPGLIENLIGVVNPLQGSVQVEGFP